jgi:hypothetical protein
MREAFVAFTKKAFKKAVEYAYPTVERVVFHFIMRAAIPSIMLVADCIAKCCLGCSIWYLEDMVNA